jgi:hypothetical protein
MEPSRKQAPANKALAPGRNRHGVLVSLQGMISIFLAVESSKFLLIFSVLACNCPELLPSVPSRARMWRIIRTAQIFGCRLFNGHKNGFVLDFIT